MEIQYLKVFIKRPDIDLRDVVRRLGRGFRRAVLELPLRRLDEVVPKEAND